jgi:hypothetical protein
VIAEGQSFAFVDWFFPDMKFGLSGGSQNASIQVILTVVDYPNGAPWTAGPFTMNQATNYINCRLRGRQIKIRIESSDIGSFWRLGNIRFRITQSGRR